MYIFQASVRLVLFVSVIPVSERWWSYEEADSPGVAANIPWRHIIRQQPIWIPSPWRFRRLRPHRRRENLRWGIVHRRGNLSRRRTISCTQFLNSYYTSGTSMSEVKVSAIEWPFGDFCVAWRKIRWYPFRRMRIISLLCGISCFGMGLWRPMRGRMWKRLFQLTGGFAEYAVGSAGAPGATFSVQVEEPVNGPQFASADNGKCLGTVVVN